MSDAGSDYGNDECVPVLPELAQPAPVPHWSAVLSDRFHTRFSTTRD